MSEGENHQVDANIEKAKVYLELAKLSQESFFNRRASEWKVAFGFWTAIGLFTYYATKAPTLVDQSSLCALKIIYPLLALSWLFLWQFPLRLAFEDDKDFKHFYMKKAEGEEAKRPGDEVREGYGKLFCNHKGLSCRRISWTIGQTIFTAFFMIGSWIIVSTAARHAEDEAKPNDRIFDVTHHNDKTVFTIWWPKN